VRLSAFAEAHPRKQPDFEGHRSTVGNQAKANPTSKPIAGVSFQRSCERRASPKIKIDFA
jgi:hypothetical protein